MFDVKMLAPEQIKPNPHNARTHSKRQIKQIANSITAFGFASPILVDESLVLIAGHGRLEAAKTLSLAAVPTIVLSGLSEAKKRALAIADNKIAQNAGWDREKLSIELPALTELLILEELDISLLGFEPVEIDQIATDFATDTADPADDRSAGWAAGASVSRYGDLWHLGKHRLLCGSALNSDELGHLMAGDHAAMAFLDPPYNVKVSNIGGRGRIKHAEFAMASGEMSSDQFQSFLFKALEQVAAVSSDGAVHYVCMDWRSVASLVSAGREVYQEMLNLVVWDKSNAGQGAFYRSQHELIGVFRVGRSQHLNNIELGRHGRNRSNIWRYPGVNTFRSGRMDDLSTHPTVKPVAIIADAMKDCTKRDAIVLDTFCGSGSTLMAAEQVGRRGFGIEIEPRYVDATIRRWQAFTKRDAVHVESGMSFDEMTASRAADTLPAGTTSEGGQHAA